MPSKPARKKLRELMGVSSLIQQLSAMVVVIEKGHHRGGIRMTEVKSMKSQYRGGGVKGEKKRVAGYIRVKEDIIQETGIALEAMRLREWIFRHPDWKCIGIYADQQPGWEGFNKMVEDCHGEKPIAIVVIRSMRRFEEPDRIKELKCPVYIEDAGIFTTDDLWPEYLKAVRVSSRHLSRL